MYAKALRDRMEISGDHVRSWEMTEDSMYAKALPPPRRMRSGDRDVIRRRLGAGQEAIRRQSGGVEVRRQSGGGGEAIRRQSGGGHLPQPMSAASSTLTTSLAAVIATRPLKSRQLERSASVARGARQSRSAGIVWPAGANQCQSGASQMRPSWQSQRRSRARQIG